MTQLSQGPVALPVPRKPPYDGYAAPRVCTCGCGLAIGDGAWAQQGIRTCTQMAVLASRARAVALTPRR